VTSGYEVVLDHADVTYVYRGTDENMLTVCVTLATLDPSGLPKPAPPVGSELIAVDPANPCVPQQLDRADPEAGLVPAQEYWAVGEDGLVHRFVVVDSEIYDCGVTVGLAPPFQP
jgi:hypothetical protein